MKHNGFSTSLNRQDGPGFINLVNRQSLQPDGRILDIARQEYPRLLPDGKFRAAVRGHDIG